jgi:hypothetical protein
VGIIRKIVADLLDEFEQALCMSDSPILADLQGHLDDIIESEAGCDHCILHVMLIDPPGALAFDCPTPPPATISHPRAIGRDAPISCALHSPASLVNIKADTAGISTPNKRTMLLVDSVISNAISKCDIARGIQSDHERVKVSIKNFMG